MVHYFKQSCLLMLWALFLVNISFTSCDDKNPEVQIGETYSPKNYIKPHGVVQVVVMLG